MKKTKYIRNILISANLLISTFVFAQQKAIQYDKDFVFRDGIYITLEDFKNNNPIPTSQIVSKSNKNDRDFLKRVLENSTIQFIDNSGNQQEIKTNTIWGYCSNGAVYINHGTDFNRIVVIGGLCHFVATIATKVANDPFAYGYGYGGFGYNPTPRYVYSTEQFILDFQSGKIIGFNADNMEILLQRDQALYNDFKKLKRKQKRDAVFLYLRKYNEKHPIFFPE